MSTRVKPLAAKFVENVKKTGRYADGNGLYLVVGENGKSKSWVLLYRRTKLGGKGKGEFHLGSWPKLSLAAARAAGGVERARVASGIDPVKHREEERRQLWLADKKNLTFLAVAQSFIATKTSGPRPWWVPERARGQLNILNNKFKSLHALPINSAEAAEVITLKLHELLMAPIRHRTGKRRPGPRWHTTPEIAMTMKQLAYNIGKHAHALRVLPINVANPGAEPLDALLTERQPERGNFQAIHFSKVPALYHTLDVACQPAHSFFTGTEAARAIGLTKNTYKFRQALRNGELKVTRAEPSLPAHRISKTIAYENRIEPADLYEKFPMVIDVIPGVRPVVFDMIKFCSLIGPRPSEARLMTWSEWDETERLWIIPWQRTKEGQNIRQDMVIPLSDPANDIVLKMRDIQRRYKMQTEYVFANYPSRFNTNAVIGQPPCHVAGLENLRKSLLEMRDQLTPEELKSVMHGFRTNLRSWGDDQRNPDGTPRFAEKDLERAIGHIAGFGATPVSRIYNRQSRDIIGLIPIFDGWAKFITNSEAAPNIVPLRRRVQEGG